MEAITTLEGNFIIDENDRRIKLVQFVIQDKSYFNYIKSLNDVIEKARSINRKITRIKKVNMISVKTKSMVIRGLLIYL